MRLPSKINPIHCASKDSTRYVLNGVALNGNLAIATNGRALFAVKGEREKEDDARIAIMPARAAKIAFPQFKSKKRQALIFPLVKVLPADGDKMPATRITTRDGDETTYQDVHGTYPNIEAGKVIPSPEGHSLRVCRNVKMLAEIAQCFGENSVTIHLKPDGFEAYYKDPILITCPARKEGLAVLMPIRVEESLELSHNEVFGELAERRRQRDEAAKAEEAERQRIAAEKAAEELAKADAWMAANN